MSKVSRMLMIGEEVIRPKRIIKTSLLALASVAQLVGALSCEPKGCSFNSWLGHIPRLQVQSLVRVHVGGS